jgi:hypothetical protein
MKLNKWTIALASAGVVSLGSVVQAEEQHQVLTALSATTLSGYVDTSVNWRAGHNAGPMPGRTFDNADKQDAFNLNVVKLVLEKPLDEGQWSAGYKADLVFGPDASYYTTLVNQGGGAPVAADDFAVKQAYAAFRVPVGNGIDFKLGVFDTIIGYEVFESGNNPNFSRSYGYALEPTHHTGLLASYHVNDMISLSAGIANAYAGPVNDRAGNAFFAKALMASVTITLPESTGMFAGSSVYAGVVDGKNGNTMIASTRDTTSYYGGFTMNTPVEGLSIGTAFDYRTDAATATLPADNWAWAAAFYASFQASEKVRLNARGEWTKGTDGTWDGGTGKSDELIGLTFTADYTMWTSLLTRAEIRWDRSINGDRPYARAMGTVGGEARSALTLALNMVYKF